ncbi:MAG: hypothetical protein II882_00260 [Lachnospiraceae bacterium]|nr:hypothetical protein [Lachnospiraceae bacterium]
MIWPHRLSIPYNLFHSADLWIFGAAGIAAAVLLHRRDRKCFIWPALPAVILWLACETAGNNIRSYLWEMIALLAGTFALCCAAAWLIMDLFYFLKDRQQEKENGRRSRKGIAVISFLMLLLSAVLILRCVLQKKEYPASYDLTKLEAIGQRDFEAPFTVGGKLYIPYRLMDAAAFNDLLQKLSVSDPADLGRVVAYSPHHPRQWYYYCTVDKLDGDWLLMFDEDGTGLPGETNVLYLCGTQESIDRAENGP